jgi:hypothetical protein
MVGEIVRAGQGLWSGRTDGPFQIHVKSDLNDECGIIFSADYDTAITDSRRWETDPSSWKTRAAGPEILSVGARVEVWYDFVLDSCPGQSHATTVNRIQ